MKYAKKRALLVSHVAMPAVDGGSRIIYKIGEELQKKGWKVEMLASDCWSTDDFVTPRSSPVKADQYPIKITRLSVYKSMRRVLKLFGLNLWSRGPFFKLTEYWNFREKLSNFDWVITGPMPTTVLVYAKDLAKKTGAKLAVIPCFHENDSNFFDKTLLGVLKEADRVGVLTDYEKTLLCKKLPNIKIDSRKVRVVGVGVDKNFIIEEEQIRFPKNKKILFLGNMAAHKRIELLIEACRRLKLELTIAGRPSLHKLDYGSSKVIGSYDQKKLKLLLDDCSLLVLPSISESFGIVLAEAWARGKPVLGTDIGPIKEIINNSLGGMTFKKDDLNDLMKKILMVKKTMGVKGLRMVRNWYTWDKVCDRLQLD